MGRDEELELELELYKRKKQRKRNLIIIAVALVVVIVSLLAIYFKGKKDAKLNYEEIVAQLQQQNEELTNQLNNLTVTYTVATEEINLDLIQAQIKDIGELATIEYLYTDAGKFEDPKKIFDKNVPFTTKSFIAKWDGVIKAGIDIEKIIVEINDAEKTITVHMPKAKILSHEVDADSVETLDQKDGLFNPVEVEDVRKFDAESKKAMEERAIENGVLEKAFNNAKDIIEKLVNNDVVKELEYTVTFETIE